MKEQGRALKEEDIGRQTSAPGFSEPGQPIGQAQPDRPIDRERIAPVQVGQKRVIGKLVGHSGQRVGMMQHGNAPVKNVGVDVLGREDGNQQERRPKKKRTRQYYQQMPLLRLANVPRRVEGER